MEQQEYQDFDLSLMKAYRKVFFTPQNRGAKEIVWEDLIIKFRIFEMDQYEDSKMQARQLGHRDVILHIMQMAGMLHDLKAVARALMNIPGQPPEKKDIQAELGEDLDLD